MATLDDFLTGLPFQQVWEEQSPSINDWLTAELPSLRQAWEEEQAEDPYADPRVLESIGDPLQQRELLDRLRTEFPDDPEMRDVLMRQMPRFANEFLQQRTLDEQSLTKRKERRKEKRKAGKRGGPRPEDLAPLADAFMEWVFPSQGISFRPDAGISRFVREYPTSPEGMLRQAEIAETEQQAALFQSPEARQALVTAAGGDLNLLETLYDEFPGLIEEYQATGGLGLPPLGGVQTFADPATMGDVDTFGVPADIGVDEFGVPTTTAATDRDLLSFIEEQVPGIIGQYALTREGIEEQQRQEQEQQGRTITGILGEQPILELLSQAAAENPELLSFFRNELGGIAETFVEGGGQRADFGKHLGGLIPGMTEQFGATPAALRQRMLEQEEEEDRRIQEYTRDQPTLDYLRSQAGENIPFWTAATRALPRFAKEFVTEPPATGSFLESVEQRLPQFRSRFESSPEAQRQRLDVESERRKRLKGGGITTFGRARY